MMMKKALAITKNKFGQSFKRTCIFHQQILKLNTSSSTLFGKTPTTLKNTDSQSLEIGNAGEYKAVRISNAMKAYLENAKARDEFLQNEEQQFEIGKRHLAKIMDIDAEEMTQDDIDRAIEYLLPSALQENAKPKMKPPHEIIPKKKTAQFGIDGRPFHSLFYTRLPNYFQLLHDIIEQMEYVKIYEDNLPSSQKEKASELNLSASVWLSANEIETMLTEPIEEIKYKRLINLLNRLTTLEHSHIVKDFIMKYRKPLTTNSLMLETLKIETDEDGREYVMSKGTRRTAECDVKVYKNGTGIFEVNNTDLLSYFPRIEDREELIFPLQITNLVQKVDIYANVFHGGPGGQAGAIRLALSIALQSFVSKDVVEQLKVAGLLTQDPRVKERKRPGCWGARRRFTWKKR